MNSSLRRAIHKKNMLYNSYTKGKVPLETYRKQQNWTTAIGDFTGIGSAYRPDPTIGSGLTMYNQGARFLCLVLTNRSPRKLEAQGDSK